MLTWLVVVLYIDLLQSLSGGGQTGPHHAHFVGLIDATNGRRGLVIGWAIVTPDFGTPTYPDTREAIDLSPPGYYKYRICLRRARATFRKIWRVGDVGWKLISAHSPNKTQKRRTERKEPSETRERTNGTRSREQLGRPQEAGARGSGVERKVAGKGRSQLATSVERVDVLRAKHRRHAVATRSQSRKPKYTSRK